jgi:hypothetical protein
MSKQHYDTDSTGSLCERQHSSWSSDIGGGSMRFNSNAGDDARKVVSAAAQNAAPSLLLPKVRCVAMRVYVVGNFPILTRRHARASPFNHDRPQILSKQDSDDSLPSGSPLNGAQYPVVDPGLGYSGGGADEPQIVESSPNWGWYVSTGTPTAPQFSST